MDASLECPRSASRSARDRSASLRTRAPASRPTTNGGGGCLRERPLGTRTRVHESLAGACGNASSRHRQDMPSFCFNAAMSGPNV